MKNDTTFRKIEKEERFELWWAKKHSPSFKNSTGAMEAAFKEIARNAWFTGLEEEELEKEMKDERCSLIKEHIE